MKVILKEYVYKHGVAGDVVDVADGFARNYLIPRGLAVRATPGNLRQNKHLIEKSADRREELRSMENEAAQKIHGVELVFGVKAGKNNKLYGSITTRDIAAALLEKTGVDINRRRISERPLRELGIHEVPVRIAADISPVVKVIIVREEEVEAYLRGETVSSLEAPPEAEEAVAAEDEFEGEATLDAEAANAEGEEAAADTVDEVTE